MNTDSYDLASEIECIVSMEQQLKAPQRGIEGGIDKIKKQQISKRIDNQNVANNINDIFNSIIPRLKMNDWLQQEFDYCENLKVQLANISDTISTDYRKTKSKLERNYITKEKLYAQHITSVVARTFKNSGNEIAMLDDMTRIYNGAYWIGCKKGDTKSLLKKAAFALGYNNSSIIDADMANRLYMTFMENCEKKYQAHSKTKILINLQNGTLEIDTATGKQHLRAPDADDLITYQLAYEYDTAATSPLFYTFLSTSLPDSESQDILSEYIAYTFIRHGNGLFNHEKVLVLFGEGQNGKSVLRDILENIVGNENLSSFNVADLTGEGDKQYNRYAVIGKLLNIGTEMGAIGSSSIFKTMASGEPIHARAPYEKSITTTNYPKLIFACNSLPKAKDVSNGFFRRFIILNFDKYITETERIRNLSELITCSELPGVLNWILKGLQRLITQGGFSKCRLADNALNQYLIESDTVSHFIEQNGYITGRGFTPYVELYNDYKEFCISWGYKPYLPKVQFGTRLQAKQIFKKKSNRCYMFQLEKSPTNK